MYKRSRHNGKPLTAVRGSRRNAKRARKVLLFIGAASLFILALIALNKLSSVLFSLSGPKWARWHLNQIVITGGTPDSRYEVYKYIGFDKGDAITARDASNLQNMLAENIKQLSSVKVSRNLFTKDLKIKIKKQTPLARLITEDKTLYLAKGGQLFTDKELQDDKTLLEIYFKDKTKNDFLSQELVELINELRTVKDLTIAAAAVDADAKTFGLELEGLAFAEMGSLSGGGKKLKTLPRVLEGAAAKNLKQPYDINFTYFDYGKIYLKQAK